MNIEENQLRKLLTKAFEAGLYGCQDIQENVVEELVQDALESESKETPVTIAGSMGWTSANISGGQINPADRRTWGQPNRNEDIFVNPPALNIETVQINANPNPIVQNSIGEMRHHDLIRDIQIQEDRRALEAMANATEEQNENPTV